MLETPFPFFRGKKKKKKKKKKPGEIFRSAMFYYVIVTSYVDRFSWCWYQWKEETIPFTIVSKTILSAIVGFFIPVSSLKFSAIPFILRGGWFILGNQYKLYRMTLLSYHGYSVSGVIQLTVRWHTLKTFMFVFINLCSSKNFLRQSVIKVPNQ